MPNKSELLLPQDFFQRLHNKHLLLDTSFFGDYSAYPETFHGFVQSCRDSEITLVTVAPVITEFTKGSDTPQIYADKSELVKEVVQDYILNIHPKVFLKEIPLLTKEYGQRGKAVSMTDFILAAMTKIYKNDLCLLTKNPKDFPTSIFTMEGYFLLKLDRALQVYGVYSYDNSAAVSDDDPPF